MKKNKSKTSGADTSSRTGTAGSKLVRRAANPLALEQRFMFDGAAVAEAAHVVSMPVADATVVSGDAAPAAAVDATVDATVDIAVPAAVETDSTVTSGAPADEPSPGDGGLFRVELPPAEVPASLEAAQQQAQQSIAEALGRADASATLGALFDGTNATQDAAQAFIDSFQRGDETVEIQLRSSAELYGAYGAFAAAGAEGTPVIYLNAEWIAAGATQDMIEGVLVEEYGHYIDYRLNGAVDTAGDEGEAFARHVLALGGADAGRVDSENDHLNLLIDGARVEVEMASLMFDNVWTTQGTYDLESNSLVVGAQLTGDRFLFQSTNPLDVWFSGNNVQGTLYAIDASNNVVSATFGEISRLVKTGNTLDAMQMYVYPGGVVDSRNPSQALLIGVRSVFNPLAGSSIGTSSDPVAAALNALLPANVAPSAVNDADTAAMPNCATATGEVPATGNVLDNDTDGNITYSINTGVTPNQLVETMDALSVTGVVSVATGAVPATGAITLANPGVVGGAYGVLTLQSDGTYSYNVSETNTTLIALAAGQSVTDSFNYTVSDGKGGVSRAILTITISGGNEAPNAVSDYEYVEEGSAGPQASGNVRDNDTDADAGDTFDVTRASAGDSLSLTPTTVEPGAVTVDAAVRPTYGLLTVGSASLTVGQAVTGTGVPANTVIASVSVKDITLKNSVTNEKVYLDIASPGTTQLLFNGAAETVTAVSDPSLRLLFVDSTSVTLGMSVAGIGTGVTEGIAPSTTVVSRTAVGSGSYVLLNQDVTIGAGLTAAADTDLDRGDTLRFTADATVIEGSFGYLKLQSDGDYEYFLTANVPDGVVTVENFTYEIEDAAGCTDTAVLRIEIQGAQIQPPAAVADTATASEAGGFNDGSGGSNPSELVVVSGLLGDDVHPSALSQEITNVWVSSTATTPEPVTSGSSATVGFASVAGTYGVLNVGADGTYEYTLNNSDPVVQALRTAGETLTETFFWCRPCAPPAKP